MPLFSTLLPNSYVFSSDVPNCYVSKFFALYEICSHAKNKSNHTNDEHKQTIQKRQLLTAYRDTNLMRTSAFRPATHANVEKLEQE